MRKLLLIALLIVGCDELGLQNEQNTNGTAVTDTLYVYVTDTLYIVPEEPIEICVLKAKFHSHCCTYRCYTDVSEGICIQKANDDTDAYTFYLEYHGDSYDCEEWCSEFGSAGCSEY